MTTIEQSYRALQPFRRLIAELVRETAGPEYGNENSSAPRREQLLNLMHQAMTAYTMSLAANRPQVLVSTPYENMTAFAKFLGHARTWAKKNTPFRFLYGEVMNQLR